MQNSLFVGFIQEDMATDSTTPLIISYSIQSNTTSALDDTIESFIGNISWAQFFQTLLVSLAWMFDAQQTFISVFTDSIPSWHCINEDSDKFLCRNTIISNNNQTLCDIPRSSWDWDYSPVHTTIVSEWDLQCVNSLLISLPASAFFAGSLSGGFLFASLADSSFGRKNMLLFSCLIMSLSSLVTTFVTNIWVYTLLRFLSGLGRASVGSCALVLASELVGKRWRGQVGVLGFLCFSLGFLSLPVIGYFNIGSSWRNMYLWTSVPSLTYCLLLKFLSHESPRWLFIKGHSDQAISTLKALMPKKQDHGSNSVTTISFQGDEDLTLGTNMFSAIRSIMETRWALKRLVAVMVAGFGIGMVYYGMPLGLVNISFNIYISVALNALAELPASLATFCLIDRLNRKTSIISFVMISGGLSILSAAIGVTGLVQVGMEIISFFSACTSANMVLIYSVELFPTSVRNSALSMVRQAMFLGGFVSPFLVAVGRYNNGVMSLGMFGLAISLCGLVLVCLPETRGRNFCDLMEDEENANQPIQDQFA